MPELKYTCSEHDYLQYYLYQASISKPYKKALWYNRWLGTLSFVVMAGCFWLWEQDMGLALFAVLAIIWFLLYPYRHRARYKQHYQRHIKTTLTEKLKRQNTIRIDDAGIFATDGYSETKIPLNEIVGIVEIGDEFFIMLRAGATIILPKNQIVDIAAWSGHLQLLAQSLSIPFTVNLGWKWV